ncbi:hypothetical protein B0H14DRAFT_2359297, partial [Mycena olivaceomarginata]
ATLMHAFLHFRKQIWVQAHRSLHEQPGIHARIISRYPQGMVVPLACYIRLRSSSSPRMVVSHSVPVRPMFRRFEHPKGTHC